MPAEVDLVEALGADTLVHCRVAAAGTLIARLPGSVPASAGQTLHLAVADAAVHVFDPETTRALA